MAEAKPTPIDILIDQVGRLCLTYCGPKAPSEPWIDTCRRLDQLNEALKRARAERNAQLRKAAKVVTNG